MNHTGRQHSFSVDLLHGENQLNTNISQEHLQVFPCCLEKHMEDQPPYASCAFSILLSECKMKLWALC